MNRNLRSLLSPAVLAALAAAPWLGALPPAELSALLARGENLLVIDARAPVAFAEGHIPGALNIPLALLPHKPLPPGARIVVYADGLGVVSERAAVAALQARPGVKAEALLGGFVGWVAATQLSTRPAGFRREDLPGLTYQQLLAADKDDVVLVDLRQAGQPATLRTAAPGQRAMAARATDELSAFATKLGVPVVTGVGSGGEAAAQAGSERAAASGSGGQRAALAVSDGDGASRLFVLVADTEATANEAARQLRAGGYQRFTILIGGMEIIRHEGRTGTGRLDAAGKPAQAK